MFSRFQSGGSRGVARLTAPLVLAGTLVAVGTAPAAADYCPRVFRDEQDMTAVSESCRETYLLNAGEGNLVSRPKLWAARSLYRSLGFNEDYLAWARSTTITIYRDSPEMWGHCTDTTRAPHEPCPEGAVKYTRVADNFTSFPVTLHVVKHGAAIVFLACGNDGPVVSVPAPAPKLTGTKFHDANGNKVHDPDEDVLAGITVTLVRESSLGDEAPGAVATAVTDEHGRYVFDMHGSLPGTYRVDETVPAGWRQTTEPPRISLDWGAGDGEFELREIGNRRIADVAKTAFTVLSAPDRLEVGQEAEFVVRAVVSNLGTYDGEVRATDMVDVVPPPDCTATVMEPVREFAVRFGVPAVLDFRVLTTCRHRSNHEWVFHDRLVPAGDYDDPNASNNTASVSVIRPVFEQVDVAVASPHITCLRPRGTRYECTVTSTMSNGLTATPLDTVATTTLSGAADCVISAPVTTAVTLGSNESVPLTAGFTADCGPGPHSFLAVVEVAEAEDHAEESDAVDNVTRIRFVPVDVKPNSDPSSINLDKRGVVPVAMLSMPGFDAVREIFVGDDTPRFGITGYEDSLAGCATGGEDIDLNGSADLVCHFDTARTGLNCTTTLGRVSGVLRDGTPWEGQDFVKVTGCRR